MVFRRLHRLVNKCAFTLAETIISMVLIAISALFLMSSVAVSAKYSAMASLLQSESDAAVSALYRGEADDFAEVFPHTRSGTRTEELDEAPLITVYYSDISDGDIRFYYYGGGTEL